ncbi:MAG: zinc ribbon domain-containing protein YjdM [Alphaproteobacteria bacterium]
MTTPICPKCESEYTYHDGNIFVCSACAHEWDEHTIPDDAVIDSLGNVLENGDTVVLTKDLQVKGAPKAIKQGTIVKGIFLINEAGHNISCKIPGFGAMNLKSEFVKKA